VGGVSTPWSPAAASAAAASRPTSACCSPRRPHAAPARRPGGRCTNHCATSPPAILARGWRLSSPRLSVLAPRRPRRPQRRPGAAPEPAEREVRTAAAAPCECDPARSAAARDTSGRPWRAWGRFSRWRQGRCVTRRAGAPPPSPSESQAATARSLAGSHGPARFGRARRCARRPGDDSGARRPRRGRKKKPLTLYDVRAGPQLFAARAQELAFLRERALRHTRPASPGPGPGARRARARTAPPGIAQVAPAGCVGRRKHGPRVPAHDVSGRGLASVQEVAIKFLARERTKRASDPGTPSTPERIRKRAMSPAAREADRRRPRGGRMPGRCWPRPAPGREPAPLQPAIIPWSFRLTSARPSLGECGRTVTNAGLRPPTPPPRNARSNVRVDRAFAARPTSSRKR